jgi:hypothetical protein
MSTRGPSPSSARRCGNTAIDGPGRWTLSNAGDLHAAVIGKSDYPDTDSAEGMLLVQAIQHGNDHRTQICSTLGALGLDVPDLDGWEYWASERG